MKTLKLFSFLAIVALVFAGCSNSRKIANETVITKGKSLEGENVVVESSKLQGIEMVDDLNEDGTKMVKVPYKWFAGIGKANDKQAAIEMAELEARATISRIIENMVYDQSERGSIINNGDVQKALTSHWEQVSIAIQNGCEPFGDTRVEYNSVTKMYTVTAKVGIRGDRFQAMLNNAGNYKPANLSGKQLDEFIDANKSIMNAAKAQ